jgi:centromeric protein E
MFNFRYGQTSSGKTHTMQGNPDSPGLIPQSIEEAFSHISLDSERQYMLRCSYIELYNEELSDLLDMTKEIKIRQDPQKGVYIEGATEEVVTSPEQVQALMKLGQERRHVSATALNLVSSRSHSIFRMVIESSPNLGSSRENAAASVRISVLNLVDLAGSERVGDSKVTGAGLKEAANINNSLLVLAQVISKLSEGKGGHVPFRDSKLTRMLQPSLGGNSRTAVICGMTPHWQHAEESISTLRFATRAKKIVNRAQINESMDDKSMLKKFREQILELQSQLEAARAGGGGGGGGVGGGVGGGPGSSELTAELEREKAENDAMQSKLERLGKMILTSALSKWGTGFSSLSPTQRKARAEEKATSLASKWRLKAKVSVLDKVKDQAASQVSELEKNVEVEKQNAVQVKSELERLQADHSALERKLVDLQKKHDLLASKLRQAETRIAELEGDNKQLAAAGTANKKELQDARQRCLMLEQKLAMLAPDDKEIWGDLDKAEAGEDQDLGIQGLSQLRQAVGMLCELAEGWKAGFNETQA